ncbi:hypothetical protein CANCADRAFT_17488, partial [Tortispora caseinolytica NRRL Y-17796]
IPRRNQKGTTMERPSLPNYVHSTASPQPYSPYDVHYTASLIPSQLLMGSPFQNATPNSGVFGSPHFQMAMSPQMIAAPQFHHFRHSSNSSNATDQQDYPENGYVSAYPTMYPALYHHASPIMHPGFIPVQPSENASRNFSGRSRTVYLGSVPEDTTPEELLSHVHSGTVEACRIFPEKNCAFISFLDLASAVHFHSDAVLKRLNIRGQDLKIGWGKPSAVPPAVSAAVEQSGATRNVYLGNLPADITSEEIESDLSKFGPIDAIKRLPEKNIAFVHFLSIASAIKCVQQLPLQEKWSNRRVFYGKDRCAYVSKTQQENAAQYLGITPGYEHLMMSADRELLSNTLAQQNAAAAAVASAAGGMDNVGNRTVYLGSIHPGTQLEEVCNVVRGGLLQHVRFIPEKRICFVTFVDATAASQFFALSNLQGLLLHNRRLKVGWGKHSGPLPSNIALAVSAGASRNVYVGGLSDDITEDELRKDFSVYGDIEQINRLPEKSCAFVNYTNIANAIKAIEAIKQQPKYKNLRINFGKDRCGYPPRQM